MRKKLLAGNWKMNNTIAGALEYAKELKYKGGEGIEVAICAPFLQLEALKEAFKDTEVVVGAQNVHFADSGAYTGEISADMLKEIGINLCIVGHSERRQYFAETDETVNKKLHKLFEKGIRPIMCVGEGLEEREKGEEFKIVRTQLIEGLVNVEPEDAASMVIAYEPIWAIGTGKTATPEQAQEMCKYIRDCIEEIYDGSVAESITIQYGGSVKPSNAREILTQPDIDGALVGGASLKPDDFRDIIDF